MQPGTDPSCLRVNKIAGATGGAPATTTGTPTATPTTTMTATPADRGVPSGSRNHGL